MSDEMPVSMIGYASFKGSIDVRLKYASPVSLPGGSRLEGTDIQNLFILRKVNGRTRAILEDRPEFRDPASLTVSELKLDGNSYCEISGIDDGRVTLILGNERAVYLALELLALALGHTEMLSDREGQ